MWAKVTIVLHVLVHVHTFTGELKRIYAEEINSQLDFLIPDLYDKNTRKNLISFM